MSPKSLFRLIKTDDCLAMKEKMKKKKHREQLQLRQVSGTTDTQGTGTTALRRLLRRILLSDSEVRAAHADRCSVYTRVLNILRRFMGRNVEDHHQRLGDGSSRVHHQLLSIATPDHRGECGRTGVGRALHNELGQKAENVFFITESNTNPFLEAPVQTYDDDGGSGDVDEFASSLTLALEIVLMTADPHVSTSSPSSSDRECSSSSSGITFKEQFTHGNRGRSSVRWSPGPRDGSARKHFPHRQSLPSRSCLKQASNVKSKSRAKGDLYQPMTHVATAGILAGPAEPHPSPECLYGSFLEMHRRHRSAREQQRSISQVNGGPTLQPITENWLAEEKEAEEPEDASPSRTLSRAREAAVDESLRQAHEAMKREARRAIQGGSLDFWMFVCRDGTRLLRFGENCLVTYGPGLKIGSYRGDEKRYAERGSSIMDLLPLSNWKDYHSSMTYARNRSRSF